MASALRAGMTLQQAMEEVSKTALAPLGQEFGLTIRQMRLGTGIDEALEQLSLRVGSLDLKLVTTAIHTARTLGANMAEIFDTLAHTIRDRFHLEGKVRTLTAQGKLQGYVMGAMPALVWIGFDWVRPDLTRPMLQHWFGALVVLVVIVMELVGFYFIRRISTIHV